MYPVAVSLIMILTLAACNLQFGGQVIILTEVPLDDTALAPSETPEQIATPTAQPPTATTTLAACSVRSEWPLYQVQLGDTLSKIASASGSTVAELVTANCLENAAVIVVGQSLHVPRQPIFPTASPLPTLSITPTSVGPYSEQWTVTSMIEYDTCGGAGAGATFPVTLSFDGPGVLYSLRHFDMVYPLRLAGTHPGYIGSTTVNEEASYGMDLFFDGPGAFHAFVNVTFASKPGCFWQFRWEGRR